LAELSQAELVTMQMTGALFGSATAELPAQGITLVSAATDAQVY
jgi:hypothetical protein